MNVLFLKLGAWLVQKLAVAALIVLLALAGYGVWLFLKDAAGTEERRVARLEEVSREKERLLAAKAGVEQRLATVRADLELQRARALQARKVIATLLELESWWERWFGNSEQQEANAAQIQRMEKLQGDIAAKLSELQRLLTQTGWERDGVEIALRQTEAEFASLEASRSQTALYAHEAWRQLKWYIALALGAYFFGPTLWAFTMYFALAGIATRGRPIRLGPDPVALPQVGESRVSVEAVLRPGEVLRIKEKYLQASDEGIARHTRFVLDWRIPFTSLACGLVELVEMRHAGAGGEYRLTLSNSDDPHIELAIVEVPAGASLVLRPSFLAGVIQRGDEGLTIRRHWRVLRWQAWITGQFRYFEFVGPCRLVIAGSRGVRAEVLAEREGVASPARRTNQDATIGFTPNLEYRPVRAETFWSYYRGMNPLFDDLFSGRGVFVSQETATPGSAAKAGKFWASLWSGVLKVFGL